MRGRVLPSYSQFYSLIRRSRTRQQTPCGLELRFRAAIPRLLCATFQRRRTATGLSEFRATCGEEDRSDGTMALRKSSRAVVHRLRLAIR